MKHTIQEELESMIRRIDGHIDSLLDDYLDDKLESWKDLDYANLIIEYSHMLSKIRMRLYEISAYKCFSDGIKTEIEFLSNNYELLKRHYDDKIGRFIEKHLNMQEK